MTAGSRLPQVARTNGVAATSGNRLLRGPHVPTLVVAASNSFAADQAAADYVCSGEADQVMIQQAINALPVIGTMPSGRVLLCAGTYLVTGTITITSPEIDLDGVGAGTVLKVTLPATGDWVVVHFVAGGSA